MARDERPEPGRGHRPGGHPARVEAGARGRQPPRLPHHDRPPPHRRPAPGGRSPAPAGAARRGGRERRRPRPGPRLGPRRGGAGPAPGQPPRDRALSLLREAVRRRDIATGRGPAGHREVPGLLRRAQPARDPRRDGSDEMTTRSDDLHVLLGAYVLGGLSDDEHRSFSEHLRTCAMCQTELGQVSGLPRLLDLAGPQGGPHLADPPAALPPEPLLVEPDDSRAAALLDEVGRRRRRRRTWLSAGGAAAAVAVFAGGAWLGPQIVAQTTPTPPTTHVEAAAMPGSSVQIDIALVTRGWGTQLDIACEDMPTKGELALWVIDRKGHATTAASWRATPAGYSKVTGATALRPNEIEALEVRTGTGQ